MHATNALATCKIIGADAGPERDRRHVPIVPNPFEVQNVSPDEADCCPGSRAARGGVILAEARKLLVEQRFAGFTIKELATRSDLSTQTIHNHFGDRLGLLSSAINDYTLALWRHAGRRATGSQRILSFLTMFAQSNERYPKLFANVIPVAYFSHGGTIVYTRTHSYGSSLFARELEGVLRWSPIYRRVDPTLVAAALSDLIGETMLKWARGALPTAHLHYQLRYKAELVLTGMITVDSNRSASPVQ